MEMTTPVLSIIVPVYNVEKYLARCIDSILAQTFTDFELILVDDGSPDNCGKICDEYAGKDPRIIVIHKENGGVSSARNHGLDIARGEYLTFIDPDDEITFNTFASNIDVLEDDRDIDFIQFPVRIINNNATYWDGKYTKKIFDEGILIYWFDNKNITYSIWSKIFRRRIFTDLRFPVSHMYAEDLFLVPDILDKVHMVYLSQYGCYNHFCHKESITSFCPEDKIKVKNENIYDSYLKFLQYVSCTGKYTHIQVYLLKIIIRYFSRELNRNSAYEEKLRPCIPRLKQLCWKIELKDNLWIILFSILKIPTIVKCYNLIVRSRIFICNFLNRE